MEIIFTERKQSLLIFLVLVGRLRRHSARIMRLWRWNIFTSPLHSLESWRAAAASLQFCSVFQPRAASVKRESILDDFNNNINNNNSRSLSLPTAACFSRPSPAWAWRRARRWGLTAWSRCPAARHPPTCNRGNFSKLCCGLRLLAGTQHTLRGEMEREKFICNVITVSLFAG